MRIFLSLGAATLAATLGLTAGSAFAASAIQKECSTKYQAAKAGNTLNGMTYNQYYKQCAAEAKADKGAPPAAAPTPTAAPAPTPTAAPAPAPAPTPPPMKTATPAPMAPAAPVAVGPVMFPSAVSPTYSSLSAGKARMKTCLDQYNANKVNNGNGGLKWIEKGGGYYSECNKKLKS